VKCHLLRTAEPVQAERTGPWMHCSHVPGNFGPEAAWPSRQENTNIVSPCLWSGSYIKWGDIAPFRFNGAYQVIQLSGHWSTTHRSSVLAINTSLSSRTIPRIIAAILIIASSLSSTGHLNCPALLRKGQQLCYDPGVDIRWWSAWDLLSHCKRKITSSHHVEKYLTRFLHREQWILGRPRLDRSPTMAGRY